MPTANDCVHATALHFQHLSTRVSFAVCLVFSFFFQPNQFASDGDSPSDMRIISIHTISVYLKRWSAQKTEFSRLNEFGPFIYSFIHSKCNCPSYRSSSRPGANLIVEQIQSESAGSFFASHRFVDFTNHSPQRMRPLCPHQPALTRSILLQLNAAPKMLIRPFSIYLIASFFHFFLFTARFRRSTHFRPFRSTSNLFKPKRPKSPLPLQIVLRLLFVVSPQTVYCLFWPACLHSFINVHAKCGHQMSSVLRFQVTMNLKHFDWSNFKKVFLRSDKLNMSTRPVQFK